MKKGDHLFPFGTVNLFLLNVILLIVGVSAVNGGKTGPFEITRVRLDKKAFDPLKGEVVNISFEITKQANAKVIIYDALGQVVRSFSLPALEAGRHNVVWDGRGTDGRLPAGEVFLYVIKAETKEGKKAVYNRAKETGGQEVNPLEYTLDKDTGEIEYVLPKACMVRIRAGLRDGMLARSLVDWKPETPGRHSFIWDGKDSSGNINLLRHRDLDLRLTCYTLPDNTIIRTGKIVPFEAGKNPSNTEADKREQVWSTKGKYLHYRHDPRSCHSPRFKVLFPSVSGTKEEVPNLSGIIPIRVELDKHDEQHLINTRFEVMFFVDGVYIYEVEEGSSPFTFHWDTKGFSKGPHIVTISVLGYEDHIGVVSRKVILGE